MSKAAGLTADVAASCPASTCHTAPPPAAGAGLNVLPGVAAASVGNCLSLMEAQEPFIVKAGCSRLQLLMRAEAARQRAVEQGAARKLLRLLQAPAADEGAGRQGWGGMPSNLATADCLRCNHGCGLLHAGPTSVLAWPLHPPTPALPPPTGCPAGVVDYAMETLEKLAGCEEGLLSIRDEGGQVGACWLVVLWLSQRASAPRSFCTGPLSPAPPARRPDQGLCYIQHLFQAVLESYLAGVQRSPTTEDAIYRAQQMLAALAPLGDI